MMWGIFFTDANLHITPLPQAYWEAWKIKHADQDVHSFSFLPIPAKRIHLPLILPSPGISIFAVLIGFHSNRGLFKACFNIASC